MLRWAWLLTRVLVVTLLAVPFRAVGLLLATVDAARGLLAAVTLLAVTGLALAVAGLAAVALLAAVAGRSAVAGRPPGGPP